MGGPMSMAINSFWQQEAAGAAPPVGDTYVAEDGTTPYTTEDGTQNYVPES
jgi:hypothetical protein